MHAIFSKRFTIQTILFFIKEPTRATYSYNVQYWTTLQYRTQFILFNAVFAKAILSLTYEQSTLHTTRCRKLFFFSYFFSTFVRCVYNTTETETTPLTAQTNSTTTTIKTTLQFHQKLSYWERYRTESYLNVALKPLLVRPYIHSQLDSVCRPQWITLHAVHSTTIEQKKKHLKLVP